MLIRIRNQSDIEPSEITRRNVYESRRDFIKQASLGLIGAGVALAHAPLRAEQVVSTLGDIKPSSFSTTEKQTSLKDISSYNNYYEFGTDKNRSGRDRAALEDTPLDRSSRWRSRQAAQLRDR